MVELRITIEGSTKEQLKDELRRLVNEYQYHPNQITREEHNKFKTHISLLLREINSLIQQDWIKKGGKLISNSPMKLKLSHFMRGA